MRERPRLAGVPLYLPVLLGTVRENRHSVHVARYATRLLEARPGVETRLFDPREWPFGDLERREWEMDPQPGRVETFVREMARADGFVIVAPEYNHGYPGALKNMLDAVYDEWNRKPFGLVGCGGMSGGMRMIEQLRLVVAGLAGVAVPRSLPVPFVKKAFGETGPLADDEAWARRFGALFDEVVWYAEALRAARQAKL